MKNEKITAIQNIRKTVTLLEAYKINKIKISMQKQLNITLSYYYETYKIK